MLGAVPLNPCSAPWYQTLESHASPISALDFSEPYGTLVTASHEDAQPRVWDLISGTEIGRLRGHNSGVKSIQVEDHICLTGGEDGHVRIWDLRTVDDESEGRGDIVRLNDVAEEVEDETGELVEPPRGIRNGIENESQDGSCLRVLSGHTKAVTALYFEDECLVCSLLSLHCRALSYTMPCRSLVPRIKLCGNGIYLQVNVS